MTPHLWCWIGSFIGSAICTWIGFRTGYRQGFRRGVSNAWVREVREAQQELSR